MIISGLRYISCYLGVAQHDVLLAAVEAAPWTALGHRRTQIYGYSYDARKGGAYRLGDLPSWAHDVALRLHRDGLMPDVADQMIANEYAAGQGIRSHIDAPLFTDTIVSLSLGSSCVMEFTNDSGGYESVFLDAMSALVISGEAQTLWKHSIPARPVDEWMGREVRRERRVSLTFRKMR